MTVETPSQREERRRNPPVRPQFYFWLCDICKESEVQTPNRYTTPEGWLSHLVTRGIEKVRYDICPRCLTERRPIPDDS